jgi:hypothetical protein
MQRWMAFECIPAFAVLPHAILAARLEQLLANPWGQALHAWAAHMWLAEGALPVPYWVLQGPMGGHKYRYSNEESEFAQWQGHEGQPPAPGELPYAELTPLSLHLMRTHAVMVGARHGSYDAAYQAKVEGMQRDARRLLLHQMDQSGLTDLAGEAAPLANDGAWASGRTVRPVDPRESDAAYVQTGRFLT